MSPRLRILNMPEESVAVALHNPRPMPLRKSIGYSLNPCTDCAGHCCGLEVKLGAVEALRLATVLCAPLKTIVASIPWTPPLRTKMLRPPILLDDGARHLVLKRESETARCMFWLNVGGQGRCGVYSLRPHACRLYPYDVVEGSTRLSIGNQLLCPTRWLKNRDVEESLRPVVAQYRSDLRREKPLLKAWERADGVSRTLDGFEAFARPRLARYLGAGEMAAPVRYQLTARMLGNAWD